MKRQRRGMTLLELMVVVGIIGVLVAIALPAILQSRLRANETAAIGDLRQVNQAQVTHFTARGRYGNFDDLTSEADGEGTAFLSTTWQDGLERNGYRFTMDEAGETAFVCQAAPLIPGSTGTRFFRVDSSGVIRYNRDAKPGPADRPIASGPAPN